jgi:hypothetical protein
MGRADESGAFVIFMFHSCHDDIAISFLSFFLPIRNIFPFSFYLENVNVAHHSVRAYSHDGIHETKNECPGVARVTCVISASPENLKMRGKRVRERAKKSNIQTKYQRKNVPEK